MTRAAPLAAAVVALAFAAPALAAGDFTVAKFSGPGAPALRAQLAKAVCDQLACVPAPKKKPKQPLPTLNGRVLKAKKAVTLQLWLVKDGKEAWRKPFAVTRGKLDSATLEQAARLVLDTMGVGVVSTPAQPPATATTTPEATPADKPADQPADKPAEGSSSGEWATTQPEKTEPEPAPAARSSQGYKPPTFAASVNLDLLYRAFTLSGLTTQNVHEYKGFPLAAPRLHLDTYPLARLVDGMLGGLGLEADFAFTLALKSIAGGTDYPSQLMRFSGAVKFRIPVTSSGAAMVPAVGVTWTSFSISKADNGSTLQGLPQVAYLGLKLGVGFEAPLLDDKLLLFLNVSFIPVLGAGELISPTYFPEGSAWGLSANVGASYQIIGGLEARLLFQFERYDLSFKSIASDTYQASGAADLIVGGTVGVGYRF